MLNIAMTVQFDIENDQLEDIKRRLLGRLLAWSQFMNIPMAVKFEKQLDSLEWEEV